MAVGAGDVSWGPPVTPCQVDIGTIFDEQFEAFRLVLLARDVRWSFLVFVFVIDIGAFIDDEALHLGHFTSFNLFP